MAHQLFGWIRNFRISKVISIKPLNGSISNDSNHFFYHYSGQTEHRFKDGRVEVHFSNGSIRISNPNDTDVAEEWKYPDGTLVVQHVNGDKILSLPNGQREVHTAVHKRREYPDGTVKLVYPDGSQETRYSNGRVRLKDNTGHLVMDSENILTAS